MKKIIVKLSCIMASFLIVCSALQFKMIANEKTLKMVESNSRSINDLTVKIGPVGEKYSYFKDSGGVNIAKISLYKDSLSNALFCIDVTIQGPSENDEYEFDTKEMASGIHWLLYNYHAQGQHMTSDVEVDYYITQLAIYLYQGVSDVDLGLDKVVEDEADVLSKIRELAELAKTKIAPEIVTDTKLKLTSSSTAFTEVGDFYESPVYTLENEGLMETTEPLYETNGPVGTVIEHVAPNQVKVKVPKAYVGEKHLEQLMEVKLTATLETTVTGKIGIVYKQKATVKKQALAGYVNADPTYSEAKVEAKFEISKKPKESRVESKPTKAVNTSDSTNTSWMKVIASLAVLVLYILHKERKKYHV